MKSCRWPLIGLLLLLVSTVHAEGVCPPGMFPTNPPGTQGPVGCAPIPGYNNNQQQTQPERPPPPQWDSRWGAIATDSSNGSLGAVTGMPSQGEAERAAMSKCVAKGGTQCKLQIWYKNGCAAMIVGNKEFNVQSAATADEATHLGMKICTSDGDANCHVYYSACSLPIQIQ